MSKVVVNLTPHEITLVGEDGTVVKYPPSGIVARVQTTRQLVGTLDGFPVFRPSFGAVEGLPAPEEGATYIVSTLVGLALQNADISSHPFYSAYKLGTIRVVAPDTTPDSVVRDENGNVVGVRGFQVF